MLGQQQLLLLLCCNCVACYWAQALVHAMLAYTARILQVDRAVQGWLLTWGALSSSYCHAVGAAWHFTLPVCTVASFLNPSAQWSSPYFWEVLLQKRILVQPI